MGKLSGRVIVITGGTGFLASQWVDAIKANGGIPVVLDRDTEKLKDCNSLYNYRCDITDEHDILLCMDEILDKFRRIDGLINNACNNPKMENKRDYFGRLEDFSLDKFRSDIDVSLVGSFLATKHFGSYMNKNDGGVIVNVGSELGLVGPDQRIYDNPKPVSYTVSKAGLIGLTKYTATYWNNVRCNLVAFGGMYNNQPEDFLTKLKNLIPMKRMANKYEYNNTIIYLLSDDSSYMTGSVMVVDGGRTAW